MRPDPPGVDHARLCGELARDLDQRVEALSGRSGAHCDDAGPSTGRRGGGDRMEEIEVDSVANHTRFDSEERAHPLRDVLRDGDHEVGASNHVSLAPLQLPVPEPAQRPPEGGVVGIAVDHEMHRDQKRGRVAQRRRHPGAAVHHACAASGRAQSRGRRQEATPGGQAHAPQLERGCEGAQAAGQIVGPLIDPAAGGSLQQEHGGIPGRGPRLSHRAPVRERSRPAPRSRSRAAPVPGDNALEPALPIPVRRPPRASDLRAAR